MRDADDRFGEVVVTMPAIDPAAGYYEMQTGRSYSGAGPSVRMAFRSRSDAETWFSALLRSGRRRELSSSNEMPKQYAVGGRLLAASLDVLGVAKAVPRPSALDEQARHTWVPSRVGPGILENVSTGRTMAFESIDFFGHDQHGGWIRVPERVILSAIGGPRWPLELLGAPALRTPDPDDRGSAGSGLEFVTAAGLLRCRDARCEDQGLLSRLSSDSRDIEPPSLSRDEVRDLLELAAEASARARQPSGAIDVDTYVKNFREIERYEVLLDDARERTIGLRHRIRRIRGGSTVRVRSERAPNGWIDPFESIVLAAEQGWVRNRTVAVRPDLAHHFATPASMESWFTGITEDGIDDWQDVREEIIEGVLGALENLPDWEMNEWQAAAEAQEAQAQADWEEEVALREENWVATPFVYTAEDLRSEMQSDIEAEIARGIEQEEGERWHAWVEACDEDPRAECPVSLSELADRLSGIAVVHLPVQLDGG